LWTNLDYLLVGSDNSLLTWLASLGRWWLGDFLGILCLIPLAIFLVQASKKESLSRIIRYASPVIVFLVCLVVGYRVIANHEVQSVRQRFDQELTTAENQLLEEVRDILNEVELIKIQFLQDGGISDEKFTVQAQQILTIHETIQAFNWVSLIRAEDLVNLEKDLIAKHPNSQGFTRRIGNGLEHLPKPLEQSFILAITNTIPYEENQAAFGMDISMFSRASLENALKTGDPQITPPLRFAQERGEQTSVVFLYPSHQTSWDQLPGLFASGELGFFTIPLRMDDFVSCKWQPDTYQGLSLEIHDVSDPNTPPALLSRIVDGNVASHSSDFSGDGSSIFVASREFSILNRTWKTTLSASREYLALYHSSTPFIILAIGLVACFLLGNYTLGNYLRTHLIEKTVELQTRELRKAKTEAEQLSHAKSEFLAVMSHEIRTPMNGMISTSELLKEGPLTPEQAELAKIIEMSANTLLMLINDILDFSKLEAGKASLEQASFDPYEVGKIVEATFRAKVREKGLRFRLESNQDKELNKALMGDEARLVQVVMNLVSNAVKFTSEGEILLRTEVHELDDGQAELFFQVKDTGIGIPKEKQQELFEPFTQADVSSTRRYGGTGLGLAIIKRIVDLLHGSVELNSEPGQGSDFQVRIKLQCSDDFGTTIQTEKRSPIADSSGVVPNTVLLVEDNIQNQRLMELLFKKLGVQAHLAEDGESAVTMAAENHYSMIFMDCRLPGMDGYEATRLIRSAESGGKHTPIVALTANRYEDAIKDCDAAGMDDYIGKPVTIQSIRAAIEKWAQPERSSEE